MNESWPPEQVKRRWHALAPFVFGTPEEPGRDLVTAAEQERIVAWIYYRWKQRGEVPEPWRSRGRAALARNLESYTGLKRVLNLLAEAWDPAGIPWLVLKGAACAAAVYPEPGLRDLGDVDILVPPDFFPEARRRLEEAGFVPSRAQPFGDFTETVAHSLTLIHPRAPGVEVDLHFGILEDRLAGCAVREDWLWEDRRTVPVARKGMPIPCVEGMILHAAAHLFAHHAAHPQLRWLVDLYLLFKVEGLDPVRFRRLAEVSGWLVYARFALEALGELVSDETIAVWRARAAEWTAAPAVDPRLVENVRKALARPVTDVGQTVRRWRDLPPPARRQFLVHLMFPTKAYMIERYRPWKPWLWPLMYPVRWGRMVRALIRAAFGK